MDSNIQHNKLIQLEISVLMYGIYNTETLEKLSNTVHHIHNTTSFHEKLLQDNKAHEHLGHFMQMHWVYSITQ